MTKQVHKISKTGLSKSEKRRQMIAEMHQPRHQLIAYRNKKSSKSRFWAKNSPPLNYFEASYRPERARKWFSRR